MGESASKSLPAGTRVGDYQITGLLGAGGMGTVYAGEHPLIGKRVAIKVLHPSLAIDERMVERFVREARSVVQIGHRNIIDVFTFGEAQGIGHYFVMPLLAGQSLGDRVERTGPLPLSEAVGVIREIASALDAAHAAGIYHRDLKPDNVFLADDGGDAPSVRLLDFGIAKLIHDEVSTTQTGAQMGTPLFMSPEQWAGADVDGRTDVYALGVLAHHVLTGRFPLESNSVMALMGLHANGVPVPPSEHGADPRVDPVVEIALAKNRDQRFDTPGAFARALATAVASEEPALARTVSPVSGAGAPATAVATARGDSLAGLDVPPRNPARFLWVLAAVAVVGALAWLGLSGSTEGVAPVADPANAGEGTSAPPGLAPAPASSPGATTERVPVPVPEPVPEPEPAPADRARPPTPGAEPAPDNRARKPRRPRKRKPAPPTADTPAKTKTGPAADPPPAKPEPDKPAPKKPKPKDETQWGDTVDPFSSR